MKVEARRGNFATAMEYVMEIMITQVAFLNAKQFGRVAELFPSIAKSPDERLVFRLDCVMKAKTEFFRVESCRELLNVLLYILWDSFLHSIKDEKLCAEINRVTLPSFSKILDFCSKAVIVKPELMSQDELTAIAFNIKHRVTVFGML